jgi:hypothetical protein
MNPALNIDALIVDMKKGIIHGTKYKLTNTGQKQEKMKLKLNSELKNKRKNLL